MNNNEIFDKLIKYRFILPVWKYVNKYIIESFNLSTDVIKLFALYFVYICDGSSCMPLSKDILKNDWKNKCDGMVTMLTSQTEDLDEQTIIEKGINEIYLDILPSLNNVDSLYDCNSIIGDNKLFNIEKDFLFARQYYQAKNGIKESIERLIVNYYDNIQPVTTINIKEVWKTAADKQLDIITKGMNKNLIITGGPGTGKTTAVFYLLLFIIKEHPDYEIYLTAPSGKASSRIKESINEEIDKLKDAGIVSYNEELDKLSKCHEYTIHRLLETDINTNGFKHNIKNQFDNNSIFIIDESSMIDICIFNSLLESIPNGARVFILGDKYQLPSVECGAVLSDLLEYSKLSENIVELDKSHRFIEGSDIYELAQKVNNKIYLSDIVWKEETNFEIVNREKDKYPVFYFDDKLGSNPKDNINKMIVKWANRFYKENYSKCNNIDFDIKSIESIYSNIDQARVLCAENKGKYGVSTINHLIKNTVINNEQSRIKGYYPGIPLMITENDKSLELYNGDTGLIVNFKGSDTLYFLIKKKTDKYNDDAIKLSDKIMKLGEYMLYPLRILDLKNTIDAYAITIHKSQGSGYDNIMVILPKKEGHPLLNRQILYTAITRTKGPTYIISNTERLNESINKSIERYTRIFD